MLYIYDICLHAYFSQSEILVRNMGRTVPIFRALWVIGNNSSQFEICEL